MAKVVVSGIAEIVAAFDETERLTVTKAAHKSAAEVVSDAAKPLVPFRSGRLLGSLRTSGTKKAGVVRAGRAAIPYAGPVHFGDAVRPQGGYVLPTPFLYDAIDARQEEVCARFEQYLEKAIATTGLR